MENKNPYLKRAQCKEFLKIITKKSFLMEKLAPGKRSIRIKIKIGCKADMFETISITKYAQFFFQKRG